MANVSNIALGYVISDKFSSAYICVEFHSFSVLLLNRCSNTYSFLSIYYLDNMILFSGILISCISTTPTCPGTITSQSGTYYITEIVIMPSKGDPSPENLFAIKCNTKNETKGFNMN